jgi:nicotinamide-nucleotide amidase
LQNLSAKSIGSLARSLGTELLATNKKVASVESCTGGGVAYAITEVAGSSQWFEKSWVTYSNQAKHEEVGVKLATLTKYGAVSSEVVLEMAEGGLIKSGADLCVSISGIAGPGGGSATKPVGLVWFAIAAMQDGKNPQNAKIVNSLNHNVVHKPAIHTRCFSRCFSGDRHLVREQAISLALKELIVSLVNT